VVDGEHDAIPKEGGVGVAAERLWRVSNGEDTRDPAVAEVYVLVDTNVEVDVAGTAFVGAIRLDKFLRGAALSTAPYRLVALISALSSLPSLLCLLPITTRTKLL
jgi:hypothetical protein